MLATLSYKSEASIRAVASLSLAPNIPLNLYSVTYHSVGCECLGWKLPVTEPGRWKWQSNIMFITSTPLYSVLHGITAYIWYVDTHANLMLHFQTY